MNSSPHRTNTRTFLHLCPMPHSLRWNSTPIIDALLCFTFLVSDLSCSSTSPSVCWFPFDLICVPLLVLQPLRSTGSLFCFSFHLSLLWSLVDTLSYDFSFPFTFPSSCFILVCVLHCTVYNTPAPVSCSLASSMQFSLVSSHPRFTLRPLSSEAFPQLEEALLGCCDSSWDPL